MPRILFSTINPYEPGTAQWKQFIQGLRAYHEARSQRVEQRKLGDKLTTQEQEIYLEVSATTKNKKTETVIRKRGGVVQPRTSTIALTENVEAKLPMLQNPRRFSVGQRGGEKTAVPISYEPGKFVKPEVTYFFDSLRHKASEATAEALKEIGKRMVTSIKQSMKPGNYRPYRSRRSKKYPGLIATRRMKEITAMVTPGSNLESYGASKKMVHELWRKTSSTRASKIYPAGTIYSTGSLKDKFGNKIGSRIQYLEADTRGGIHYSSKPGNAPAPDTETLKNSVTYDIVEIARGSYELRLIADTKYAKILELGSATKNIAPRPYLRRAFDRIRFQQEFARLFGINWEKGKTYSTRVALERKFSGFTQAYNRIYGMEW